MRYKLESLIIHRIRFIEVQNVVLNLPTPPGDTIDSGLSISKAAIFPIANP